MRSTNASTDARSTVPAPPLQRAVHLKRMITEDLQTSYAVRRQQSEAGTLGLLPPPAEPGGDGSAGEQSLSSYTPMAIMPPRSPQEDPDALYPVTAVVDAPEDDEPELL